jgi:DMSO/TMAO reductase YedYZ molybdopterin-dependent catalytic subunit
VRLVVPGWYGTNSVKWLEGICVRAERAMGPFVTNFYNEVVPEREAEGLMRPVWEVEVSSMIVSPAPGSVLEAGSMEIWGWAWVCQEITQVCVSLDDGESWKKAMLEARRAWEWQRWSIWVDLEKGDWEIVARARDREGRVQPMTGRRNMVHRVGFEVV